MAEKYVLFAFNGDPMCFVHVMLTALDMKSRGFDVRVVIEGSATKLVETLSDDGAPFAGLYRKMVDAGVVDCVCRACAHKTGSLKAAEAQGFVLCDELSGHPSMARYIGDGYNVLTF